MGTTRYPVNVEDGTHALLALNGVAAGYARLPAVQDISIQVRRGETVALIGPNGCGKSTILRVAIGLIQPMEGSIHVAGEVVTGKPPWEIVKLGVGYLRQGAAVFDELTVQQNLAVAAGQIPAQELLAQAESLEAEFPILSRRHDRAGVLSAGERQMLGLALAFVRSPRLVLLDEPAMSMAAQSARDVLINVAERCRRTGSAALIAEQRVSDALAICDRAYGMKAGQVVVDGPRESFSDKVLASLFA